MLPKKDIPNVIRNLSHAMVCLGYSSIEENGDTRNDQTNNAKKLLETALEYFNPEGFGVNPPEEGSVSRRQRGRHPDEPCLDAFEEMLAEVKERIDG